MKNIKCAALRIKCAVLRIKCAALRIKCAALRIKCAALGVYWEVLSETTETSIILRGKAQPPLVGRRGIEPPPPASYASA